MALKIVTALTLSVGLAAFAGHASAQMSAPMPQQGMSAANDDDNDVLSPAEQSSGGGYQSQSLPPAGNGQGAPSYANAPSNAPVPGAPIELNAQSPNAQSPNARPQMGQPQMGQSMAPSQGGTVANSYPDSYRSDSRSDDRSGLRPPADINGAAASTGEPRGIIAPAPGAAPGTSNSASLLPPEDQPEQGSPKELPPNLRRQTVEYFTKEPAGTIIIDTPNTYLYLVLGNNQAMRYGIGVGREGFTWAGKEKISRRAEWPDWHPPSEMIERQPYLPRFMAGGESNPLGSRALYIGNKLYRIHGTNQPSTIGTFVSSGCIRLVNSDIEDLYERVKVGTKIVVLPGNPAVPPTASREGAASASVAPASQAR